jgi:hypothetical protein
MNSPFVTRRVAPLRFSNSIPSYGVLATIGILGFFDLASAIVVGFVFAAGAFCVSRLSKENLRDAVGPFVVGLLSRLAISVIQTGNQLVLLPKDANYYESRGALVSTYSVFDWYQKVQIYSSSTRGIIIFHSLVTRLNPVFRPGLYVAFLAATLNAVGIVLAFRSGIDRCTPATRNRIIWFLSMSPPFLFWGSQNTKEGFIGFGLALVGFGAMKSKKWRHIFGGIALCWVFRPYIGAIALAGTLAAWLYTRYLARKERSQPLLLAAVFLVLLGLGISQGAALTGKEVAQYSEGVVRSGGGSLDTGVLGLSASHPLLTTIRSFMTPPPWFTPTNIVEIASFFEGIMIAILLVSTLVAIFRKSGDRRFSTLAIFFTVFIICAIYGLGSNIGTNVRIRTTIYPILAILFAQSRVVEKFSQSELPK